MIEGLSFKPKNNNDYFVRNFDFIGEKPNICPFCLYGIDPIFMGAHMEIIDDEDYLFIVWKCPKCREIFLTKYKSEINMQTGNENWYCTIVGNFCSEEYKPTDEIKTISPRFCAVFNEAIIANSFGLTEIAGGGFRKALEILIKDYVIHVSPEKEQSILKGDLYKIIEENLKYITSGIASDDLEFISNVRKIGNSKVHYVDKYGDEDMERIKEYIFIIVNTIQNKLKIEKTNKKYNINCK
jgi:hypothetical protein